MSADSTGGMMDREEAEYYAKQKTPPPMQGTWTLTRPDGESYEAETPLRCVALEMRERVPPEVAIARVIVAAQDER